MTPKGLFRGLMLAQAGTALVLAVAMGLLVGSTVGLAVFWGGMICLLAHAWGGFQVWLHPGNRAPERMATAAVRAELGKVAIILVLFWLTFSQVPESREQGTAAALLAGFFVVQVAGWVALAREGRLPESSGRAGNKSDNG